MEDYPKTLMEFEERFATEKGCREYLFKIRWPEGFCCPCCKGVKAWATSRYLYKCVRCGFHLSVITDTIFQDTKKPLRLWFRAIWHLTSQKYGANALGLQRVLGLGSYHTEPGRGCTNSAGLWCDQAVIASRAPSRQMKLT